MASSTEHARHLHDVGKAGDKNGHEHSPVLFHKNTCPRVHKHDRKDSQEDPKTVILG